jgi:hypothetical protein
MAYAKDGYPVEAASKIGHLKIVGNQTIRRVIESFEAFEPAGPSLIAQSIDHVDLSIPSGLRYVVTIDGGQTLVPNQLRREKTVAFIQVAACLLKLADLERMRRDPMMDPGDVGTIFRDKTWTNAAVVPLSGVRVAGQTVRATIRETVHHTLLTAGLVDTLRYLVSREWDPSYQMPSDGSPRFDCWSCDGEIVIPKSSLTFPCPHCGESHRLVDYLEIGRESPDDCSREETASALRNVMETLKLFHLVRSYLNKPDALGRILFIKDGPLLLRAALSRLIEPIRALIEHMKASELTFNLVGVEKTGDLVSHIEEFQHQLPEAGDCFIPTVRYLVEEVAGKAFGPNYRNRVSYGAKVLTRVGPQHLLALNIPTGDFELEPNPTNLISYETIVRALSQLVSYRYPNALLPLMLANDAASISQRPSGPILQQFVDELLR